MSDMLVAETCDMVTNNVDGNSAIHWCISWAAALIPDAAMIPDSSVFSGVVQSRSLTATVSGAPGLLLMNHPEFLGRPFPVIAVPLAVIQHDLTDDRKTRDDL